MKTEIYDLFPLSVVKDKILLSSSDKKELTELIFGIEKETKDINKNQYTAWLGDTRGHEFLFKNPKFYNLAELVEKKIKTYSKLLHINNEKLEFYHQRTWATITRKTERIHLHSHDQSNISFAYYLLKPENSGDIRFAVDPQNEIAKGLFDQTKLNLGLLDEYDKRNSTAVDIKVEEDDIIIFPSKTKHSTIPNASDQPRISISGDVCVMLKDSYGHERLMPNYSHWKLF